MSQSNVCEGIETIRGAVEIPLCSGCSSPVDPEKACNIAGGRILLCDDCVVEMWQGVAGTLARLGIVVQHVFLRNGETRFLGTAPRHKENADLSPPPMATFKGDLYRL